MVEEQIRIMKLLLSRLERISADSVVTHRASGVRGSILRALDDHEKGFPPPESQLKRLTDTGYILLEKAAREIGR